MFTKSPYPTSNKSFSDIMAKSPRIYTTVGPFTFAYPHLTAPDTEGKFADNKYKVDGIASPTDASFKDAKTQTEKAAKELGMSKGGHVPLNKQMAKDKDGNKEATGDYVFRAKSKFAPAIVDAKGTPVPDKKLRKLKIGAGSTGLLQGYYETYEGANAGMSFTLTGVQLLSVENNTSSADFAAYEGGGWSMDDDDGDDLDDEPQADVPDDADDDGGLDI